METNVLTQWSRNGSAICPHDLRDWQKCHVCNVIIFDRPLGSMRDLPFNDLLIASPRNTFPTQEELPDLTKRLKGENAIIELDAKTKFKYQKDFLLQQLEQESSNAAVSDQRPATGTVTFKENIARNRAFLFPKHSLMRFASNSGESDRPSPQIRPPETQDTIINLASAASLSISRLKIFLPPSGDSAEFVEVDVDGSLTVADVVDAVVRCQELAGTGQDWLLRWIDDEMSAPDFDLPPLEADQFVTALNANEFCMCLANAASPLSSDS